MQDATEVLGWTLLSAAVIGAGNWAGMLEGVPQGGMYQVEVRSRSGAGDVIASAAGVNQWGVGDVYGVIGSSSAERWFTRSEEHTSELQSLMRISYAVFCLKKKKTTRQQE